ncbi:unnamed protein product, partial [Chrysoparadoxa australica]
KISAPIGHWRSLSVQLYTEGGGGVGGGSGSNGGNNDDGRSGDGDKDDGSGPEPEAEAVEKICAGDDDSLPDDLRKAIAEGQIPASAADKFAALAQYPVIRFLMKSKGWRDRLLGDRSFLIKVGIEVGNGIVAQLAAEYGQRKERFFAEFDFVLADCLTCCFANFAAVWTSCPTLSAGVATAAAATGFKKFVESCPTNAFQTVLPGAVPFGLRQRFMALLIPMPELFVVGFVACLGGYGLTTALSMARQHFKPETKQNCETAPILLTSLGVGTFLAISSNLRYQIVAGAIEQRTFDQVFMGDSALALMLS